MDTQLSENQCAAIKQLARVTDANVISLKELPSFAAAKESLNSKKFDYSGSPIEYMQDLTAEKVLPTWPRPGEAGIRCITEFLTGEAKEAMEYPAQWKLPYDLQPAKSKKSLVRASDREWFKICEEGYKRGMFCMVDDKDVPRDKAGHLVVNGAGGVHKVKVINGVEEACQRFISVLIPTNEILRELPGEQDTLPYVGQLTTLMLAPDEDLYMDLEDLQSAFNLFPQLVALFCLLQKCSWIGFWEALPRASAPGALCHPDGMEVRRHDGAAGCEEDCVRACESPSGHVH